MCIWSLSPLKVCTYCVHTYITINNKENKVDVKWGIKSLKASSNVLIYWLLEATGMSKAQVSPLCYLQVTKEVWTHATHRNARRLAERVKLRYAGDVCRPSWLAEAGELHLIITRFSIHFYRLTWMTHLLMDNLLAWEGDDIDVLYAYFSHKSVLSKLCLYEGESSDLRMARGREPASSTWPWMLRVSWYVYIPTHSLLILAFH